MLGEYDLAAGAPATPGRRLTSMMAPTVVVGADGPRLVVGSAGSVRLRGAIMQVIANVLGHGLGVAEAIDRPRVHVDEPHVHCEGGFDAAELDRLEATGYDVVRWRRRNLFFGGTNAVEVLADGSARRRGRRPPGRRRRRRRARRCRSLGVERRHLAVAGRPVRAACSRGEPLRARSRAARSAADARARRGGGEDLLLRLDAELDAGGELEIQLPASGSGMSTSLPATSASSLEAREDAPTVPSVGGSWSSSTGSTMPVVNDRPA